jgi:RimJ/RimL family protein N-acetyltransferase
MPKPRTDHATRNYDMSKTVAESLQVLDKEGCMHRVRPYVATDRSALEHFYATFDPKRSAQGLPPADPQSTRRWLNRILPQGIHIIVEGDDRRGIAGHMMLVPAIGIEKCVELATFIHQSIRNRGLGTILNQIGARIAASSGQTRIWLSVELSNKAAMRSYEKIGFRRTTQSLWVPEIEMELDLSLNAGIQA